MIVKLTLLSTKTETHPMKSKKVEIGYSRDYPTIGVPIILWYAHNGDSRFLRTGPVKNLIPSKDSEHPEWLAFTEHSEYRIESMAVHFESERQEFEASVNGKLNVEEN